MDEPQKKRLKDMTPEERTDYNRKIAVKSYYKNRDKILAQKKLADEIRRANGYLNDYYQKNRQKIVENQRLYDAKKREERLKIQYQRVLDKIEAVKTQGEN